MTLELKNVVSPNKEMMAYEMLWSAENQTLKSISEKFQANNVLPSELLKSQEGLFADKDLWANIENFLSTKHDFSVSIHRCFQYPRNLRDAKYPIELFYYKGDIGLLESRCISVVGSRKCSKIGLERTTKLVKGLVEEGFTIVSGLALGVDKRAMTTAIENGGRTIGVIGTPIDQYYPKENKGLQDTISSKYLLISQVPFYRYANEAFKTKKRYFPQRNETMAALSEATVIVEASDTSGTLTQARACLQQGRKLFILESCFKNPDITWPTYYEKRGAIRVRDFSSIFEVLTLKKA